MKSKSEPIENILEDATARFSEQDDFAKYLPDDLEWYAWPQMWGSTALGFGGIGGCAMTTAQTYVVFGPSLSSACVYFAGRFAYMVPRIGDKFIQAMKNYRMPSVREWEKGLLAD